MVGGKAHLGEVPAADVGRLLIGVESALARAIQIQLRRRIKDQGRREKAVAAAARIRLKAIRRGSVLQVLELPSADELEGTLDLDVSSLSEDGLIRVLNEVEGIGKSHAHMSRTLANLGRDLQIGDRYEKVEFQFTPSVGKRRKAVLDQPARERLMINAGINEAKSGTLIGTLFEANFERRSAKLRSPEGDEIAVAFPPQLDDDVQEALREQAGFEGEVSYDPETLTAKSVRLRNVERAKQLIVGLDPHAFWRFESFEELARHQSVSLKPFDPNEIFDVAATAAEREALQEALKQLDA